MSVPPEPTPLQPRATDTGALLAERLVSRVLFWGGVLSVGVTVLGFILYVAHGGLTGQTLDVARVVEHRQTGQPAVVFVSVREVTRALTRRPIDPLAVITLGLLGLLATPTVGVVVAIVAFAAARDREYALIATIVLAVLLLGFFLSGGAA